MSVELLDASVWREIGSEEAKPAPAFLEALSRLANNAFRTGARTPRPR
jgi:hypothetical protein